MQAVVRRLSEEGYELPFGLVWLSRVNGAHRAYSPIRMMTYGAEMASRRAVASVVHGKITSTKSVETQVPVR